MRPSPGGGFRGVKSCYIRAEDQCGALQALTIISGRKLVAGPGYSRLNIVAPQPEFAYLAIPNLGLTAPLAQHLHSLKVQRVAPRERGGGGVSRTSPVQAGPRPSAYVAVAVPVTRGTKASPSTR